MTNVKFNGVPFERTLTSLVDDFFTEAPGLLNRDFKRPELKGHAPVNITEKENAYEIEVVAPGFEKSDFTINLENNLLVIAAEKKAEENGGNGKSVRKEYFFRAFKRTFTVDNKIDTERIEARYVNGILIVVLHKKEATKETSKSIIIE